MKIFTLALSLLGVVVALVMQLLQWGMYIELSVTTKLVLDILLFVSVANIIVLAWQSFNSSRTYQVVNQTKFNGHVGLKRRV